MANKTYELKLSVRSVEELKKQLINYRDNELPNKVDMLVERLKNIGLQVVYSKIEESPLGKYVTVRVESSKMERTILATGVIKYAKGYAPFSTILAIEFGAGIHHNKAKNPNADKYGYGVGTFPNQMHAFEDGWYYWDDLAKEWKYTHGVKATMPMYEAEEAMRKEVLRIAKEVFK